MNDNQQKQLGAGMSATRVRSEKTNGELAGAIRKSPDYLRVKDELYWVYDGVLDRLAEALKPLGIGVVQVHVRSAIPRHVRWLHEKLAALRAVPEAKAETAKSRDEFPSWLEGNWCEE